jgi:hypothetical protein
MRVFRIYSWTRHPLTAVAQVKNQSLELAMGKLPNHVCGPVQQQSALPCFYYSGTCLHREDG